MNDKLVIITQARAGGTRFEGKMFKPLLGQPLILWHLARLSQVQTPHTLVVACPLTSENEPLAALCRRHGYTVELVPVPEDDVLARFAWVAEQYTATEIVRTCGDCPTIDAQALDAMIAYHRWHTSPRPDHTGIDVTWPDGYDMEIFSRAALDCAHQEARLASEREHVTPYIYGHPERFHCQVFPCVFDCHDIQLSIDSPYDLSLLEQLLKHTFPRTGLHFTWQDLHATLLLKPALAQQIKARPARNRAYVEQVARERGEAVQTWESLRYGKEQP